MDPDETAAHFYGFAEIIMGATVNPTGGSYDFSGTPVNFDDSSNVVVNMFPDPTLAVMQTLLAPILRSARISAHLTPRYPTRSTTYSTAIQRESLARKRPCSG